jgi:hypothetical protein
MESLGELTTAGEARHSGSGWDGFWFLPYPQGYFRTCAILSSGLGQVS